MGIVDRPRWAWIASRRAALALLWLMAAGIAAHHIYGARLWRANEPDTPAPLRRPNPGGHGYTRIDFGGQWLMGRMLDSGRGQELYHRQRLWEAAREGFPRADETPVQRDETILLKQERVFARSDDDVGHDAENLLWACMGSDAAEWSTVSGAAAAPLVLEPLGNPFASIARCRAAADAVTPAVVAAVEQPAIGGPLYPPIHAFFYAPLGLLSPRQAYFLFHFIAIGFAIFAGRGIAILTGGWAPWPAATIAVLLYPGCRVAIALGQNPTLSLCIAVWGWVLAMRGRNLAAGAVWGLFAFKPVWGMAFFLVPLLMGRWRMCLAMVGTGALLGALTLPFVGLHSWFDWLKVGSEAADVYTYNWNWIHLSRDLQGIPRRLLLDWNLPEKERDSMRARAAAWVLWGAVFAATVLIYRGRADRTKAVGLGAAFLFLGAWLSCYRFMYYDVLLSIVGAACLAAEPRRFFRPRAFSLAAPAFPGVEPERSRFGPQTIGYANSFPLTVLLGLYLIENVLNALGLEATLGIMALGFPRIHAATTIYQAWDTAFVLLLWAWCGWRLLLGDERQPRSAAEAATGRAS